MKYCKGQSLVEIIVAVSIFIMIAMVSAITVIATLSSSRRAEEEAVATALAGQGMEAVRSIANQSWSDLVLGQHGLNKVDGKWVFSGTSDINGKYSRVVTIAEVQRDLDGNIIDSGGQNDTSSRKITVDVSWNYSVTKTSDTKITSYLTEWQRISYVQLSVPVSPTQVVTPTVIATATPTPSVVPTCDSSCRPVYASGVCRKSVCKASETEIVPSTAVCSQGFVCCCR